MRKQANFNYEIVSAEMRNVFGNPIDKVAVVHFKINGNMRYVKAYYPTVKPHELEREVRSLLDGELRTGRNDTWTHYGEGGQYPF
jgi:hypothetical protein